MRPTDTFVNAAVGHTLHPFPGAGFSVHRYDPCSPRKTGVSVRRPVFGYPETLMEPDMSRIRRSALLVACVLLVSAAAYAQEKRAMGFVDTLEMPSLQDPQLSPDGRQILFVLDRPDWKNNRRSGHIYRINADGTNQVQLTFGERGESAPRWSPDGKSIAFTARRDADTNNQIYLLRRLRAARRAASPTIRPRPATSPGRPTARRSTSPRPTPSPRREGQGSRAGRRVYVRREQLQAPPPVDHRPRRQDEEDHRRRLFGERLRIVGRRQARGDDAREEPAARVHARRPKCG